MKNTRLFALVLFLCGCANTAKYQASDWYSGGYKDEQISESEYKVYFNGDNTDLLTIQTFWLYRASELTIEKGFNGFEILAPLPDEKPAYSTYFRVPCLDLNLVCSHHERTPWMDAYATIRLIKGTVKPIPYRLFNAHDLKRSLDPLVKGKNCGDSGLMFATSKVCPHDKKYLIPKQ